MVPPPQRQQPRLISLLLPVLNAWRRLLSSYYVNARLSIPISAYELEGLSEPVYDSTNALRNKPRCWTALRARSTEPGPDVLAPLPPPLPMPTL